MLQAIREALKVQTEELEFCGRKVIVRELPATVSLPIGELAKTPEEQAAQAARWFQLVFVRSVLWADGEQQGQQVFTDEDIPTLEQSSKRALRELDQAVQRVNGLDVIANAKK